MNEEYIKVMNLSVHLLGYCKQDDPQMDAETKKAIDAVLSAWDNLLFDLSKDNAEKQLLNNVELKLNAITTRLDGIELELSNLDYEIGEQR